MYRFLFGVGCLLAVMFVYGFVSGKQACAQTCQVWSYVVNGKLYICTSCGGITTCN